MHREQDGRCIGGSVRVPFEVRKRVHDIEHFLRDVVVEACGEVEFVVVLDGKGPTPKRPPPAAQRRANAHSRRTMLVK